MDEALLGFDAREMRRTGFREIVPHGGQTDQFLLRTDLDDVLSADTLVWPSLFDSAEIPRPQWIGPNTPFWEDLAALRGALAYEESDRDHPYCLIAATWHSYLGFAREESREGKFLGPHLAPAMPEHRDVAWRFLGFDVTDGGFISGLSNCGYRDAERGALAAEWARHLNRYHLFDQLDRAFPFRVLTNARVPEHAPFFVIGLWLIAGSLLIPESRQRIDLAGP